MDVKLVIFDMDGVLVDSEPAIRQSSREALEEWGVKAELEDFRQFSGMGDDIFIGGVSEKYGVCIAAVARWAKNNGVQRGKPVNGIMPFEWTEDDCRRFEQRQGKGWKKGVPRNKE